MNNIILKLDFEALCDIEPRLVDLRLKARELHASGLSRFELYQAWYKQIKPQMIRLVGFSAEGMDKRLHTCAAYDCAYETLFDSLTGGK